MMDKNSLTAKKFQEIGERVRRDFAIHFKIEKNGLPSNQEAAEWFEKEFVKYYSDLTPPELVEMLTVTITHMVMEAMNKARMMTEILKHLHGLVPPPED